MDEYEARAFNVLHIHPVPVVLHRLALTICETKKAPRVWDAFFVNAIFRCLSQESNPEPTDPKSGALSIELLRQWRNYTRK